MRHKTVLQKLFVLVMAVTVAGLLPAVADDEIKEGWYYIKSKYNPATQELSTGNNPAGLTVQNGNMAWDQLLRSDPAFIFKLEKADDTSASTDYAYNQNMFYLYNLKEDSWYNGIGCLEPSSGTIREDFYFKQDKKNRKYLTFEKNSDGDYFMRTQIQSALPITGTDAAEDNDKKIIIMGSSVSTYQTTAYIKHHPFIRTDPTENNTCVWTLEEVPDAELNVARMKVALRKACQMLNDYSLSTLGADDLITNTSSDNINGLGSQLFSMYYNTGWWGTNQPLSHLVDGQLNTWFMSAYTDPSEYTTDPSNMTLNTPFIQVDLSSDDADNKQAAGVQLSMAPCTSNWGVVGRGWAFFPTDITVFGTNDASIAEQTSQYALSQISTKGNNWYKIGDYDLKPFLKETDDYYGQTTPKPTMVNQTSDENDLYVKKNIVFPNEQKYRFIRFYINNTTVNYSTQRFTKIAELQLKELSDITATHGLQNMVNTLSERIATGNSKIKNGETISQTDDVDNLQAAMDDFDVQRSVTISSVGYATFVSDVNVELPTGLTAYYVTATDDNKATLSEVVSAGNVLPAGKPVILQGTAETYNLTVTSDEGSISISDDRNLLKGSATEHTSQEAGTNYTLQSKNGSPVFMKYSGTTLKAGYAYLPASTSASPAFLNISSDAATGIHSAVNEESNKDTKTYDLEGRSVKHPQKGIYIRGGKKVVIK